MAASQLLGLESYVAGHSPSFVSIHADPISWVVVVYNRISKRTVAGYFGNPLESKGFEAMQLPISDDGDLSGLEVRLLCVLPQLEGNVTTSEQIGGEMVLNQQHIVALYEGLGVPTKNITVSYARGSKLISVNMAKGTLSMRNWPGEGWRPPEPDENASYDPPEPNEEMFWRKAAGAGKLRK